MKFPLPTLRIFQKFRDLALERVLNRVWRMIFVIFVILLVLDALIFYQYGLGHASVAPPPSAGSLSRVDAELLRAAAVVIDERQTQFQSASSTLGTLANPFR
jgi:hypothetical protein